MTELLKRLRRVLRLQRFLTRNRPPNEGDNAIIQAIEKTSFSPEEAFKSIPTVQKIHHLFATATNRLSFKVTLLGQELPDLSARFDAYASLAFADWYVLGYTIYDGDLHYIPFHTAPAEPFGDQMVIVENINKSLERAQALLFVAYEFYRALAQVMKNLGAWNFAVIDPQFVPTQTLMDEVRQAMAEKRRRAGAGGVEFITAPMTFESITPSISDLSLNEIATLINREFCDLFSIDSSLLNDPENKTYSNKSESLKALYSHTIIPACHSFCAQLTRIMHNTFGHKYIFDFGYGDVENLIAERKTEWEILKEAHEIGAVTTSEVRKYLEMHFSLPLSETA